MLSIKRIDESISKVLLEDLQSKMPQLIAMLKSKKSKHSNKHEKVLTGMIRNLAQYDPTPNDKYITYMVKQLKFGNLRMEDAGRLGQAIETFAKIIRSETLKQKWEGYDSLDKYKNWKQLEDHVEQFKQEHGTETSEEKVRSWKRGVEKILSFELMGKGERWKKVEVLKITSPEAAVIYGSGTRWCTTILSPVCRGKHLTKITHAGKTGYANTAKQYLSDGPLYIIRVDGRPYIQATGNFKEFMNPSDRPLIQCSPFLSYILGRLLEIPEIASDNSAVKNIIEHQRKCPVQFTMNPEWVRG